MASRLVFAATSALAVTPYATGLTSPRGLAFGPDGILYVTEAGTGGPMTATGGPTEVAFVSGTLYVQIELGGCSHGLPDDLPAILRVHPDGSTGSAANLNAWHRENPPHFIKLEHNPIAMTRRGENLQVGRFGEDGGPSELAEFDRDFGHYWLPFETLNPIVGLAWRPALRRRDLPDRQAVDARHREPLFP